MAETATGPGIRSTGVQEAHLDPWPIPDDQIKNGRPDAAGCLLWQSEDKRFGNGVWICATGSFDWEYTWDETIYFLQGEITITDHTVGKVNTYRTGDMIFVPTGTRSTWEITKPVRKVFHFHSATPVQL